uniref:C16orf52 homolog n=1 Tax=Caligus rogercresseyi TaxID=217165 RepID=C1BMN0_CALRO|nr:C16orf52 homolog [Caligus rogercresseyi]
MPQSIHKMMDKLTVMSCLLFFTADLFALASLLTPNWIVTHVGGDTRLGLLQSCFTIYRRNSVCQTTDLTHPEWTISLLAILFGIFNISLTIVLIIVSQWRPVLLHYAKWIGFSAVILFCIAAVIFPIGFSKDEIGGAPYQLPNSFQVGISYISFVMSLWITVVSELFASKVCLPHF